MAQCYGAMRQQQLQDTRTGSRHTLRPASTGERSPRLDEEIKQARAAVEGPFSFMKGKLPRFLGLDEHLALGVNIAWYPGFTHHVTWAALWDFMQEFQSRGIAAWEDFVESRKQRFYPIPEVGPEGEGLDKQRELEALYLSGAMLDKYRR